MCSTWKDMSYSVLTFINSRLGIMYYLMILSTILEMEVISSMSLSSSYLKRLKIVMKVSFKLSMRKEIQAEFPQLTTVCSWFIETRRITLFLEQHMSFILDISSINEHKNQKKLKRKISWSQKKEWWRLGSISSILTINKLI